MKTIPKAAFWVTNCSPMNVTLADLALNIRAYATINLLDKKHYSYTLEQLEKSKAEGSLYKKGNKIAVRLVPPPEDIKNDMIIQRDAIMPSRERSVLSIKDEQYAELQITDDEQKKQDEEFAAANADLSDLDAQKITINKEKI